MGAAKKPYDRTARQGTGRIGGLTGSKSLTPEQRSERARKAGLASAEAARKRREGLNALRAALKAQGWTDEQIEAEYGVKKPALSSNWRGGPRPSSDELDPYLREVDEEFPEGLTYEQRVREATLRLRLDRQRAIEKGLGE